MTEVQIKSERPKCRRRLLDKYRGYNFMLDDEGYFTLPNKDHSGRAIINLTRTTK